MADVALALKGKLTKSKWDILVIILFAVVFLLLDELGKIDLLIKLPFITLMVAYTIGRFVGSRNNN